MTVKGFRYSLRHAWARRRPDGRRRDVRYFGARTNEAIHAIGKASNAGGRGVYEGPGISVKLSALHPRYSARAARARDDTPSCCRGRAAS